MRPKIICHMVSSVDGRLYVDRYSAPAPGIGEETLRRHYDQISDRFQGDGWLVGRVTMQEVIDDASGEKPTAPSPAKIPRSTHVADVRDRNLAVCFDPRGKCRYTQDHAYGDHLVAVLGEHVSDAYLTELRAIGISYLFAGPDGHDIPRALETLGETFRAKTLILQGGALINGAFLKAGLIDEISLLMFPAIDGLSGVPSIFEYAGDSHQHPADGQSLRLLTTETLEGGVVWLHYAVEKS